MPLSATAALPAAVRGPVLFWAFCRFASACRSLVIALALTRSAANPQRIAIGPLFEGARFLPGGIPALSWFPNHCYLQSIFLILLLVSPRSCSAIWNVVLYNRTDRERQAFSWG